MSSTSAYVNPEHISAVEAGRQFGYTNDYITRLAREKKVVGARVGKQWYVDAKSLEAFIIKSEESKREYTERLRDERKRERMAVTANVEIEQVMTLPDSRASALAKAGMVLCAVFVLGGFLFASSSQLAETFAERTAQQANIFDALKAFALRLYGLGDVRLAVLGETETTRHSVSAPTQNRVGESSHFSGTDEALVVVPPDDTRSIADIMRTFSDEVRVVRDPNGESGVITPLFRDSTSSPYRYLMVPMDVGRSP